MTQEQLLDFAAAWGAKDLDRVMSYFADDAELRASAGPEPGLTSRGVDAIRAAVDAQFRATGVFAEWEASGWVEGDRGVLRWRFVTGPERTPVIGCDLLELRDGSITLKDAYRKIYT